MTRAIWRAGGLTALTLALSATQGAAQEQTATASAARERRLSLEGAAGLHLYYRGNVQSVAFGFAPTRSLTLLVSAERSYVRDEIERYEGGYSLERGGTEQFFSAELRYAIFVRKRVSPYVLGGAGRGISRPNVSEVFPDTKRRDIYVIYFGAGVRIPVRRRLDFFADARITMAGEAESDYFGVRYPVRAGVAWRF
jgi:hypothetical protein